MTVHRLTIAPEDIEIRVDVLLTRRIEGLSRSRAQKLIRQGLVTLGGHPIKPGWQLREGQEVEIRIPEPTPMEDRPQEIPLKIVQDDELFVVIEKSVGMVVHPGAGNPDGTLVNALLHRFPGIEGVGGVRRPGLVHRLDKDTSGLLVVAKTDQACRNLQEQFSARTVVKQYLALVHGEPDPALRLIDRPIGRHPRERKRMAVRPDGRAARTRILKRRNQGRITWLLLGLETGRTHQIRVHLAHLGHPLVGDAVYGGRRDQSLPPGKLHRQVRELRGLALHACHLAFDHPGTGERIRIDNPPPRRLRELLRGTDLTGLVE